MRTAGSTAPAPASHRTTPPRTSSAWRGRCWKGAATAVVNVLNPERIVLGGSLGRIHPHVAATTAAELARRCLAARLSVTDIVPASLGEESALVGAAELALGAVLADPQLVAVLGTEAGATA